MKVDIQGVKIDNLSLPEVLEKIEEIILKKEPCQLTTPNAEMIVLAQRDRELLEIINHSLSICDGMGPFLASKILKRPLKERIAGVDLVYEICRLSAEKGYRVYFLGGEEGVALKTAMNLKKLYPKLKIAGTYAGRPDEEGLIQRIKKRKPQILFVAFGMGKQEKFIAKNLKDLRVPLAMGVGGAFNYISGQSLRPPKLLQRLALEWLFRLLTEPWRWRRQLALPKFVWLILKEKFAPPK